MNNYTLVITTLQAGVQPDQVQTAVEALLIRALPPVTLRFDGLAQPDDRTILVAVASDGKREFIMETLRGLEGRVPARLERVEWGNQVSGARYVGPFQTATDLKMAETTAGVFPGINFLWGDPYAKAEPQRESAHTYRPGRGANLRGAAASFFLLAWVVFMVIDFAALRANRPFLPDSPLVQVGMEVWLLLSLFVGPPYLPWRMVSAVTCDAEGITIRYWLGKTRRLAWAEIHSINANPVEMALYPNQKPIRFSINQRTGFLQDPMLVKTILTRAELVYVKPFVYKRKDAPE